MKIVCLALFALMFSFQVKAQSNIDPYPGLYQTAQYCAQLQDETESVRCMQGNAAANWSSLPALRICDQLSFDSEKTSCVLSLLNQVIEEPEARVCDSQSFPEDKWNCLKKVQRPYRWRTFFKVNPDPGKNAVAQMCEQFFFDEDKNACVALMSRTELFTVDAVHSCSRFFSDADKLQCLESISNKFYFPFESDRCESLFADHDKLRCFSGFKRRYRLVYRP